MTLLQELGKLRGWHKQVYFMWKHGLRNNRTDFRKFTEEELINRYMNGDRKAFERLEVWESTEQYAHLVWLMLKEQSHKDILQAYQAVAEKAKQGDDKAIKTLLMLQKEINKKLKEETETKEDEENDLIME